MVKCKNLTTSLNGKLKCKLYNEPTSWRRCEICKDYNKKELKQIKPIRKVGRKRVTVSDETYKKVYERDKGRCRLCGNIYINLHHIVYRSEDRNLIDEPSNCIMLCVEHHYQVHKNKHYWQPRLKQIIKEIENE